MPKFLIASCFMFVLAVPALAKPTDAYPVSCNDLWAAVKGTLEDPRNYAVTWMDDAGQRAAFIVVGNLTTFTDRVSLAAKDGSCVMNVNILEVGADNGDWRQFHNRLAKSLARVQAAKAKAAETGSGQP